MTSAKQAVMGAIIGDGKATAVARDLFWYRLVEYALLTEQSHTMIGNRAFPEMRGTNGSDGEISRFRGKPRRKIFLHIPLFRRLIFSHLDRFERHNSLQPPINILSNQKRRKRVTKLKMSPCLLQAKDRHVVWENIDVIRISGQTDAIFINHTRDANSIQIVHVDIVRLFPFDAEYAGLAAVPTSRERAGCTSEDQSRSAIASHHRADSKALTGVVVIEEAIQASTIYVDIL